LTQNAAVAMIGGAKRSPEVYMKSLFPCLAVLAVTLVLLPLAACQSDPNPVRGRVALQVGPATFQVEKASTDGERATGLMFRTKMAENEGMLFIFERDEHLNFWMKNTVLPLSIAYIAADGTVKEILDMQPQSLDNVPSTWAVRYALEVNQGAFARAGVKVGDKMALPLP
jgi:uncharacterized membrane protein (UPF0127 family)